MRRVAIAAAAAVLLLTGCSQEHQDARGKGDAPVSGQRGDDSPAFCTNMPNDFGNVCGKCVYHFPPWAVVVTTSTGYAPSSMVMFQAPKQCGGTVVEGAPPITGNGNGLKPPEDD